MATMTVVLCGLNATRQQFRRTDGYQATIHPIGN